MAWEAKTGPTIPKPGEKLLPKISIYEFDPGDHVKDWIDHQVESLSSAGALPSGNSTNTDVGKSQ